MIRLAWWLARAGGSARMILLAVPTALASGLLLVAVAMVQLPAMPNEVLFDLVADTGTRGGTVLAVVALTLPLLALLHQVVRLGTASRERRLAALRVAGATPGQVRVVGALEVGLPVTAGAVLGIGVYALLRLLLGGERTLAAQLDWTPELVPTTVTPAWWQVVGVVALVSLAGVVTGWWASGHVIATPLGVTRRQRRRPPRPWGMLLLGLPVLGVPELFNENDESAQAVGLACVSLAIVGVLALGSWTAHRVGHIAQRHARSAATLLAARRLVTDPRSVGRAAAALGAIGLVSGGASVVIADFILDQSETGDSFYIISFGLLGLAVLVALVAAASSIAVCAVEALLDRKRPLASLHASGVTIDTLVAALRREALLAAIPLAVMGMLLGIVTLVGLYSIQNGVMPSSAFGLILIQAVLTVLLIWLAIGVVTTAVRPWLRRATTPANLRTE